MKLWRLIVFIVVFALLLLFIGLNLENKCDIRFGTAKMILKDVPVFLTVFSSFMVGLLCAFPFAFAFRLQKKVKVNDVQGKGLLAKVSKKKGSDSASKPDDQGPIDKTLYGID